MATSIIETGARLDLGDGAAARPRVTVTAQLFAQVLLDGEPRVMLGPTKYAYIEFDRDPTSQLVEAAHLQREANMGTIYGDLVLAGIVGEVTRLELYTAPFRIELTKPLRELVAKTAS